MQLKELTNDEFEQFTKQYKISSMYQSVEYALVMTKQNNKALFLGLEDEGEIKAATLVLIESNKGFKYALSPRGFLLDYEDKELLTNFTNLIRKYLSKKGVMAIKMNPMVTKCTYTSKNKNIVDNNNYDEIISNIKSLKYFHLGYNNYFEGLKPRFESIINLNKPLNELFHSLNKQFKTKIKKANAQGIQIYRGNDADLEILYNQAKEKYPRDLQFYKDEYYYFSKNNKIDCYYAKLDTKTYLQSVQAEYQNQVEKCNIANDAVFKNREKDNNKAINKKLYEENILNNIKNELVYATNLLKEKPEGIILATALIVKHQKSVYLFMDGYNADFKKFSAKHLLIWKLIEKYATEKYRHFNMGGIASFHLSSKENKFKGLNEFRLGFGGTGYEYAGDFELKCNKLLYFIYQSLSPVLKNIKKKKKKSSDKQDNSSSENSENKKNLLDSLLNKKKDKDE